MNKKYGQVSHSCDVILYAVLLLARAVLHFWIFLQSAELWLVKVFAFTKSLAQIFQIFLQTSSENFSMLWIDVFLLADSESPHMT